MADDKRTREPFMTDFGSVPDISELGPKMQALRDDRQRRFVWAYALCGDGVRAAKWAGYSAGGLVAGSARMRQRPEIIDALREVSEKYLAGLLSVEVRTITDIMENPNHPQRLEAAKTYLSRFGYPERKDAQVKVEHTVNEGEMIEFARRLALEIGVPETKLIGSNRVIEGKVNGSEVE